jgi:hypothetical protein
MTKYRVRRNIRAVLSGSDSRSYRSCFTCGRVINATEVGERSNAVRRCLTVELIPSRKGRAGLLTKILCRLQVLLRTVPSAICPLLLENTERDEQGVQSLGGQSAPRGVSAAGVLVAVLGVPFQRCYGGQVTRRLAEVLFPDLASPLPNRDRRGARRRCLQMRRASLECGHPLNLRRSAPSCEIDRLINAHPSRHGGVGDRSGANGARLVSELQTVVTPAGANGWTPLTTKMEHNAFRVEKPVCLDWGSVTQLFSTL